MLYGSWGKILVIDVGSRITSELALSDDFYRKFVGGRSAIANLLLQRELYRVDPLSEKNEIIIFAGPLTSSMVPGASKAIWGSRSPLTGYYLDSAVGGRFPYHLKRSGYDGLIIKGVSSSLIYLEINDGEVRFKNASFLKGLGCFDTEEELRKLHGSNPSISCVGPAGENKVSFAMVHTDFYHQVGRGGIGAILGSKNIKALIVEGKKVPPFYKPNELFSTGVELIKSRANSQQIQFRIKYGTLSTLDLNEKLGISVGRNFQTGVASRYPVDMNRDYITENHGDKNLGCLGCPVPCGKGTKFERNGEKMILGGPEYETMGLLGTNLEVSAEGLLVLNKLCDDLGLDTITAGNILGFVTEAIENGELSVAELGVELKWGDVDAFETVLRMIALRQGLGDKLALGVRKFAETMNLNQDKAIHVKGLELPGYDPRGSTGFALEYAIADRGGCHRRARPLQKEQEDEAFRLSYQGKGKYVADLEDNRAFIHSLVLCDFLPKRYGLKISDLTKLIYLATGWNPTVEESISIGARALQQARIFNVRCGLTFEEDTLPKRFFKEVIKEGPSHGLKIERSGFEIMLKDYYEARGWDQTGVPTSETLAHFGLEGF